MKCDPHMDAQISFERNWNVGICDVSYNPTQDIMCYVIIMHKLTYSLSNYMRNYPYNKEICNMSKMCNGNSVFSNCKDCLLK